MTDETRGQLDEILSAYSKDRGNLLPILEAVQQRFGYLPEEAMDEVACFLGIADSTVYSVATFYAHFRLTPPASKVIRVCQGPACHLRGSNRLLKEMERRLDIKSGEATGDLKQSLETTPCSGACALSPVIEVDDEVHGRMTESSLKTMLRTKQPD